MFYFIFVQIENYSCSYVCWEMPVTRDFGRNQSKKEKKNQLSLAFRSTSVSINMAITKSQSSPIRPLVPFQKVIEHPCHRKVPLVSLLSSHI